ncbi:MAG: hypothetical protein QOF13_200 [Solirubrobacterales bacterium]|nr:hypothetical protein [Solirubrobacterales bacterium]
MGSSVAAKQNLGVRFGCLLLAALAVLLVAAATTSAAPASVTIDSLEPTLEEGDGGASKSAIGLTNLTDTPIEIVAAAKETPNCVLSLDKTQLPPAATTAVAVSIPASCRASDGLTIELTTAAGAAAPQSFPVIPKAAPETKPDWQQLWAFAGAFLLVALALAAFYFGGWKPDVPEGHPPDGGKRRLDQRLGSLDATWKFGDNWATNVTTAGALLTGLFGATTAKAFLGEEAESLVALATVGAAIALAFVSAAPILALATKSYRTVDAKKNKKVRAPEAFTVGGVLCAAAVVLTGAIGQLWVVAYTASELDLGSDGWLVWVAFGIAVLLLGTYTRRTLRDTLERGTAAAPAEKPEVEIVAAKLIVKAIAAATKPAPEQPDTFAALDKEMKTARNAYRQRTRSALI